MARVTILVHRIRTDRCHWNTGFSSLTICVLLLLYLLESRRSEPKREEDTLVVADGERSFLHE